MSDDQQIVISDVHVAEYLYQHPDFFNNHLDVLEKMHIPHPTGEAISLISKQLDIFRLKHQEQEKQLTALIDIAKENDISLNRMRQLTLALLEANSLKQLLLNLHIVLAEYFLTDFVALKIIGYPQLVDSNIFVAKDNDALKYFNNEFMNNQPSCGRPALHQARFLFDDLALEVRSCAIIPMSYTKLEGLLAIGSRDETRFHHSMGHLFLMHMSELLATRIISLLEDDV